MSLGDGLAIDSIAARVAARDRMPDLREGFFMVGLDVLSGRLPGDGIEG